VLKSVALIGYSMFFLAACAPEEAPRSDAGSQSEIKLYVFDCGELRFNDVTDFGLSNDETAVREMFVPCYLIDHPDGSVLWDAGLPLDVAGKGRVEVQEGAFMSYNRSLLEQLADIGHHPSDVDYVALSHMHFDHAGAGNAFAASKLLIQRPEHTAAFENADQYPVFDPALYAELANSETLLLDGDHDIFGDGRVVILSAPGHTPGHQVLYINLANTGPLVLSGDLYHFRESRALRRTPAFNTDAEQTLASMDKVEAFLAETGATLWIEHDKALAETLELAPAFYD